MNFFQRPPSNRSKRGPRALPPRLVPRRYADHSVWYIRFDGQSEESTGCVVGIDDEKAELRLAEFMIRRAVSQSSWDNWRDIQIRMILTDYKISIGPVEEAPDPIRTSLEVRVRKIDMFVKFFGSMTVGELGGGISTEYVKWRMRHRIGQQSKKIDGMNIKNVSYNTAVNELVELRRAFQYAMDQHRMPMPRLARLRIERADRTGLTRNEVARLLWACRGRRWNVETGDWMREPIHDAGTDEPSRTTRIARFEVDGPSRKAVARFILVGVGTGTRHRAMLELRWFASDRSGSVDIERGVIRRKGLGQRETNKRRSSAKINDVLRSHLRRWKHEDASNGIVYVIHKSDGQPYRTTLHFTFREIVRDAGLDTSIVTPHVLRHTVVHWLLDAGASSNTIADLIGCSVETLNRFYGRQTVDGQEHAIECLNDRGLMRSVGRNGDDEDAE